MRHNASSAKLQAQPKNTQVYSGGRSVVMNLLFELKAFAVVIKMLCAFAVVTKMLHAFAVVKNMLNDFPIVTKMLEL